MEPTPKKLLDQVRDAIRLKHYSIRTEEAYVNWIKRYIYFHNVRHPAEMGTSQVQAFLTHLAVREDVAACTQNQPSARCCFRQDLSIGGERNRGITTGTCTPATDRGTIQGETAS
jgi:hypothetical protein